MAENRTYTLAEAATELGYAVTTLRDHVTQGRVPHHRRFRVKGVYFTESDLEHIRHGRAVHVSVESTPTNHRRGQSGAEIGSFEGLRSLRAR